MFKFARKPSQYLTIDRGPPTYRYHIFTHSMEAHTTDRGPPALAASSKNLSATHMVVSHAHTHMQTQMYALKIDKKHHRTDPWQSHNRHATGGPGHKEAFAVRPSQQEHADPTQTPRCASSTDCGILQLGSVGSVGSVRFYKVLCFATAINACSQDGATSVVNDLIEA